MKILILLTSLFMFSTNSIAAPNARSSEIESLSFVAPTVYDRDNFSTNSQVGTIVYDALDNRFYGKDIGTDWKDLSAQISDANQVIYFFQQESFNTDGGTFTAGSWQTRVLNQTNNPLSITWASLSSNQITLDAGTYEVEAWAPAYQVGVHQSRFRNITDSTVAITGENSTAGTTDGVVTQSHLAGAFTISAQKTFELQHLGGYTKATNGFGTSANISGEVEIYSRVKIRKLK